MCWLCLEAEYPKATKIARQNISKLALRKILSRQNVPQSDRSTPNMEGNAAVARAMPMLLTRRQYRVSAADSVFLQRNGQIQKIYIHTNTCTVCLSNTKTQANTRIYTSAATVRFKKYIYTQTHARYVCPTQKHRQTHVYILLQLKCYKSNSASFKGKDDLCLTKNNKLSLRYLGSYLL